MAGPVSDRATGRGPRQPFGRPVRATDVEFEVLGGPDAGPTLDLDYERFAYAGKFVVSHTGKAVARDGGAVVAAVAFDRDRTDAAVVRVRYVTVRADRRGEGIGARLLTFVAGRLLAGHVMDAPVREVRIAVNNVFAYEAAYKAGFGYADERTGLAEVVLARPGDRSAATYRRGLDALEGGSTQSDPEAAFLAERRARGVPPLVDAPRDP